MNDDINEKSNKIQYEAKKIKKQKEHGDSLERKKKIQYRQQKNHQEYDDDEWLYWKDHYK